MGETRTLRNGAIADIETGKIIAMPSDSAQIRTLARYRWEKHRQAFADGITDTIRDTGLLPPGDDQNAQAWRFVASKATQVLLDSQSARGVAELVNVLAKHADYTPSERIVDPSPTVPGIGGLQAERVLLLIQYAQAEQMPNSDDIVDIQTDV